MQKETDGCRGPVRTVAPPRFTPPPHILRAPPVCSPSPGAGGFLTRFTRVPRPADIACLLLEPSAVPPPPGPEVCGAREPALFPSAPGAWAAFRFPSKDSDTSAWWCAGCAAHPSPPLRPAGASWAVTGREVTGKARGISGNGTNEPVRSVQSWQAASPQSSLFRGLS